MKIISRYRKLLLLSGFTVIAIPALAWVQWVALALSVVSGITGGIAEKHQVSAARLSQEARDQKFQALHENVQSLILNVEVVIETLNNNRIAIDSLPQEVEYLARSNDLLDLSETTTQYTERIIEEGHMVGQPESDALFGKLNDNIRDLENLLSFFSREAIQHQNAVAATQLALSQELLSLAYHASALYSISQTELQEKVRLAFECDPIFQDAPEVVLNAGTCDYSYASEIARSAGVTSYQQLEEMLQSQYNKWELIQADARDFFMNADPAAFGKEPFFTANHRLSTVSNYRHIEDLYYNYEDHGINGGGWFDYVFGLFGIYEPTPDILLKDFQAFVYALEDNVDINQLRTESVEDICHVVVLYDGLKTLTGTARGTIEIPNILEVYAQEHSNVSIASSYEAYGEGLVVKETINLAYTAYDGFENFEERGEFSPFRMIKFDTSSEPVWATDFYGALFPTERFYLDDCLSDNDGMVFATWRETSLGHLNFDNRAQYANMIGGQVSRTRHYNSDIAMFFGEKSELSDSKMLNIVDLLIWNQVHALSTQNLNSIRTYLQGMER